MREKRSDVDSGQCRDLMSVIYLANVARAVQRASDFAAGQHEKATRRAALRCLNYALQTTLRC